MLLDKSEQRPLCSSFPTSTRFTGIAVGFPALTTGIFFVKAFQQNRTQNDLGAAFSCAKREESTNMDNHTKRSVYNGYEERIMTGQELFDHFVNAYECFGRHL